MSKAYASLKRAYGSGFISDIAWHFANYVQRLDPQAPESVIVAAALVSESAVSGEIRLELAHWGGGCVFEEHHSIAYMLPEMEVWYQELKTSPLVSDGESPAPLVLTEDRCLYLYRYYELERRLAALITLRSGPIPVEIGSNEIEKTLDVLFGDDPLSGDQRNAARNALDHRFMVISGGPGTGKTSTVMRTLRMLWRLTDVSPARTLVCAPTGKAAARLREVMGLELKAGDDASGFLGDAVTIHRLLGWQPGGKFKYGLNRPLNCDLLILDEASMVDIALMVSLLEALPKEARLVLLGDRDQLSSVEAGAVLGDLCRAADKGHPIGSVTSLRHNWRFGRHSEIANLAAAVREGQTQAAVEFLNEPRSDAVVFVDPGGEKKLEHLVRDHIVPIYKELSQRVISGASCLDIFSMLDQVMVICARRNGVGGVNDVNRQVRAQLRTLSLASDLEFYLGLPLMVTKNEPTLGLFNGDVGVVTGGTNVTDLKVVFQRANQEHVAVSINRLPECHPAYALTVHKAQGSQANRVILVLPETDSKVLSRELVYTGLTRARESVEIWSSLDVFSAAVSRSAARPTGLMERFRCH